MSASSEDDLFGSDHDSEVDETARQVASEPKLTPAEVGHVADESPTGTGAQPPTLPEHSHPETDSSSSPGGHVVAEVSVPNLKVGNRADKLSVMKTGRLISLNPHRFDPSRYSEKAEVEFLNDGASSEDGMAASMPTKIVRWRAKRGPGGELLKNADGSFVAESNARIVRWSDGTMSLAVGSAPMLHISNVPVPKDQSYVFVRQMQTQVNSAMAENLTDEDTLPETSLECIGVIGQTMALRPAVVDAEVEHTIVQKQILGNASKRKKELKTVHTSKDPEAELLKRQQALSEALRKERKNRDEGSFLRRNQKEFQRQTNAAYLEGESSDDFDEDELASDDDDYVQSTRVTRSSRKRGRNESNDEDEEEENGDASLEPAAKLPKIGSESSSASAAVGTSAASILAGEDGDSEDDEDEDSALGGKAKSRQVRKVVSAMDDDSEED